jgi:aspartate dehydrogenase
MITVGICGLGAIGLRVAQVLAAGEVDGMRLAAVSARDVAKVEARVAALGAPPPVVTAERLADLAEVVVDCAPAEAFDAVAGPAVEAGRVLVTVSVAALLDRMELVDRARATGARIVVPSGAILGLDAVRAMAEGEILSVTLETRKPPRGLAGAPHLVRNGIEVEGLTGPKRVFSGTAREAARGFPANVNVAAALSLAGVGPDRTTVEVWADPGVDRNVQSVRIVSEFAEAEMTIRNVPSAENPRTGRIVAPSIIACLRRMTAPLVAGT